MFYCVNVPIRSRRRRYASVVVAGANGAYQGVTSDFDCFERQVRGFADGCGIGLEGGERHGPGASEGIYIL